MHNVRCILKPSFLDSSQLAFVVQPICIWQLSLSASVSIIYYPYLTTWTLKLTTFMHVASFYFWHLQRERERFSVVNYRCQIQQARAKSVIGSAMCGMWQRPHYSGRGRGSGACAAPFELTRGVQIMAGSACAALRTESEIQDFPRVARTCIEFRKWVMFLGLRPSCQLSWEQKAEF